MSDRLGGRRSLIVAALAAAVAGLAAPATAGAAVKVRAFPVPLADGNVVPGPGAIVRGLNGQEWFTTYNGTRYHLAEATRSGTITKLGKLAPGGTYPVMVRDPNTSFIWLLGDGANNLSALSKTGHQTVVKAKSYDFRDMVLGPGGRLCVTDNGGFIDQFKVTNTPSARRTRWSSTSSFMASPDAIAYASGRLWFSDDVGQLYWVAVDNTVQKGTGPAVSDGAHTMTGGPGGYLWAISYGTGGYGHTIFKLNPSTGAKLAAYKNGIPSSAQLTSLTVGSDGDLWFPEAGANEIGRLDPATGQIISYPLPRGIKLPLPTPQQGYGIARGPHRTVWFTAQTKQGTAAVGEVSGLK